MPYYKWQGVDIHAHTKTGWLYADSMSSLSHQLFQKEVALTSARIVKIWHLKKPKLDTKIAIVSRAATLLQAGLPLPAVFALLAENSKGRSIKSVLSEASFLLSAGASLHEVTKRYALFDNALVGLAEISASTGNIAYAFEHTYHYLQARKRLKSSVWAAMLTPLITLILFLVLFTAMIVFIVPQFESVYKTFNGTLPLVTLQIVALSNAIRDIDFWISFSTFTCILIIFFLCLRRWAQIAIDYVLLYVPGIGRMVRAYYYSFFLLSVGQLLNAGLSLHNSLKAAQSLVKNRVLKKHILYLIEQIEHGVPLHTGMSQKGNWDLDVIALIVVGYESGALSTMILQSSQLYNDSLSKQLNRLVVLTQPCLLVVLGVLIGYCVYALYAPLFSLGTLV